MPPTNVKHETDKLLAESPSAAGFSESSVHSFYSVPAPQLSKPSKKPHHLHLRFSQRQKHSHSLVAASVARQAFLDKRRLSLSLHNNHIKAIRINRQLSLLALQSKNKANLQKVIQKASKNRQQIISEQQSHAAETVEKAKSVANKHTKMTKQQQEDLKKRLDVQLKLSEQRRLEKLGMRVIPRSKLLEMTSSDPEEQNDLLNRTASIIQRYWRYSKIRPIAIRFEDLGLSLHSASLMEFSVLTKIVQKEETLKIVDDLLNRLYLSVFREDNFETKKKNHPRLFLSAYLMVSQNNSVIDDDSVVQLSQTALQDFEAWLQSHSTPRSNSLRFQFLTSWSTFVRSFNAWKAKDTEKLVSGMIAHWLDIERLWISVMHQIDADTQWRPRIEHQQRQIVTRLSKFGKSAMNELRLEQRKLRTELASRSTRDGGDSDAVMASEDDSDITGDTEFKSDSVLSTSPQTFPSMSKSRRDSVTMSSRTTSLSPHRSPIRSTVPLISTANSQSSSSHGTDATSRLKASVSLEFASLVSAFAAETDVDKNDQKMTNEGLAHELIMDPEFELKPKKLSHIEERVTEMAKQAFFDSIRDGFTEKRHLDYLPGLLIDIRKQLLSIVNEGGKIAAEINQVLDIELLKQQLQHNNNADLQGCLIYITTKMGQLCAPIRDSSIREIVAKIHSTQVSLAAPTPASADHLIATIRKIFELLESMRLDLANYRLKSLRPTLAAQSIEYESNKFKQQLEANTISLTNTNQWLQTSAHNLQEVARQRNPEGITIPENRVRFEDVYTEALLSLLFSPLPLSAKTSETSIGIPETLYLDTVRLQKYQNETQAITVVAALVMLARNTVPRVRADRMVAGELKHAVWALLLEENVRIDGLADTVVKVVEDAVSRVSETSTLTEEEETLVRSMVSKTLSPKNAVFALVARRLQLVLKQFLAAEEKVALGVVGGARKEGVSRAGDARAVATNSELVSAATYASAGLDMVRDEVEALGRRVVLLARHNKKVHAERYDRILSELLI
ncbi:hypothetical protein HK096_008378 [Nowakowskiella sp. JEL0078]|nr:hypothetical protein HK096_008378 [Nowakowskiella sp. JEL0078]